jgi:hypothetical protein
LFRVSVFDAHAEACSLRSGLEPEPGTMNLNSEPNLNTN